MPEGDETAHEQAGGDEQSERKGDFEDYDGIAHAAVAGAAASAFAGVTQLIVKIAASGLQGGSEAEYQRGYGRDGKSEEKDRGVQADYGFRGNDIRGDNGDERAEAGPGEERAESRAACGEDQTFDQELADDSPAACAESSANGEFFFAGGGAGEQQAGYIAAGDEKKKSYGGEDDE